MTSLGGQEIPAQADVRNAKLCGGSSPSSRGRSMSWGEKSTRASVTCTQKSMPSGNGAPKTGSGSCSVKSGFCAFSTAGAASMGRQNRSGRAAKVVVA